MGEKKDVRAAEASGTSIPAASSHTQTHRLVRVFGWKRGGAAQRELSDPLDKPSTPLQDKNKNHPKFLVRVKKKTRKTEGLIKLPRRLTVQILG